MDDYITLEANEVFKGNENQIILTGRYNGLFRISTNFKFDENAPVIRNLHTIGGETEMEAGFIIQKIQHHFIFDSCSTSGEIKGQWSGGICGSRCSGNILITKCWSSGDMSVGTDAGGIAGAAVGFNGNFLNTKVQKTHCHSTGAIGDLGGGICGEGAGQNGHLVITHSYSMGKIGRPGSGGICGWGAGHRDGLVKIEHCYSEGEVANEGCGGIVGNAAGISDGTVHITNLYSRGDITSLNAGGIAGALLGTQGGTVFITNVYVSGENTGDSAGGIISQIFSDAKEVSITMSVYNGEPSVGRNQAAKGVFSNEKNSGNLDEIDGTVYC